MINLTDSFEIYCYGISKEYASYLMEHNYMLVHAYSTQEYFVMDQDQNVIERLTYKQLKER